MINFIIQRLLVIVPTMFVIITLSFFLIKIAPGGPFDGEGRALDPEIMANVLKSYNLDKPLYEQYILYLGNIIKGDFGPSFKMKDFTVTQLIGAGAPISLQLGLFAIIIALILGVILGSIAALKQNTYIDYFIMSFSMIGIVIPNFALVPLITLFFSVYLGLLPVAGWFGGKYMILPIFTLALPYIAYIARLMRGSMLEVLNSNFIRTAYSKGLPQYIVLFKHALKPALLPIISFLGPAIAGIITGSVIIETIFDIPGLGRYFVQASLNRDYPLVLGLVIFYSFIIIVMNFIIDILYTFVDPKIRLNK